MKEFNCLLPKPVTVIPKFGCLRITPEFTIGIEGCKGNRIVLGVSRFLSRLAGRTGLFFGHNEPITNTNECSLVLKNRRQGKLILSEDESYIIEVSKEKALLSAETDLGILRGLETILQLLTADQDGYFIPALSIEDRPRFPWRGLMIDCARHFQPLEVIKRNLDGMAAVKLNVFHWHLTDDQGFRVESKVFPRLHQCGSHGNYYTQEQIREVITYADERGIRVIPEFDLPGHTSSWVLGYPELASAPGPYLPEITFGIKDTVLNPAQEETYNFLETFFQEMASLFPDEYIHIGGDETNGKQWLANPEIRAFMRANHLHDPHELQSYFNQRLLTILTNLNKKMIGWDEILSPGLPSTIVIQSWRGKESMVQAAKLGYKSILSHGYYLDLIQPADFHYLNDPLTIEDDLTLEQSKNILGGEATMWSEFVSPETIDSRLWPRTAAIAERLWSPSTHCSLDDLYQRLDTISLYLEEFGLSHEKNYLMMLRRLVGSDEIAPLKNLVDVCEPVKLYQRVIQRSYTTFSPLTRVVDAARPDAKIARNFQQLVDDYLSNYEQRKNNSHLLTELEKWLNLWLNNHSALEPIIKRSPVLHEIHSLSTDLSMVAGIGLETLQLLETYREKQINLDGFYERQKYILEEAKKPRGQVELVIVSAIEKLVKLAWEISQL